ncbi:hypothetical protein HYR99_18170 [Candidatus Poribacteria bacterium]|nr:hypothetical protein [Candidatus Poribacteria bacterium]
MTQIILDEHLDPEKMLPALRSWTTVQRIVDVRPGEVIKDDRVLQLLHTLKQPTFVTIDDGFWDKNLRHPGYCILYFAFSDDQQDQIPPLLRQLFRFDAFKTKRARMGKVARVHPTYVDYWQWGDAERHTLPK